MAKPDHPPAFQFYVNDFASDSKVEAMTTEAVGAYILLLCKAWREEPPGSLPDDDTVLARWARITLDRWTEIRPLVLAPFTLGTDSRWHQKRMRHEYSELVKRRRVRETAGRAGAVARWQTHGNRNANGPPSIEEEGKAEDESFSFSGLLPPLLDQKEFREALGNWLAYKAERGENYKPVGLRAMISRAERLAGQHGLQAVMDAMQRAAANRWMGWDQPSCFEQGKSNGKTKYGPGQKYDPSKPVSLD